MGKKISYGIYIYIYIFIPGRLDNSMGLEVIYPSLGTGSFYSDIPVVTGV